MPHTETHKRGAYAKGYSLKELGLDQNFYQKWKDNELQILDTEMIGSGIKKDWEKWSSPDANIHEREFKKLTYRCWRYVFRYAYCR